MTVFFYIALVIGLGFAPGLFWLWFFYSKDKWEPEPKSTVLKIFGLGMAVVLPVWILEIPIALSKLTPVVAIAGLFFVGIIEEYAKYFVVRNGVYNKKDFNEPMDGIVYGASSALGFASVENVLYLFATLRLGIRFLIFIFLGRALISTFAHAMFSSIWGSALGKAKFNKTHENQIIFKGVLVAALIHGLFNGILLWGHALGLLADGVLLVVLWIIIRRQIQIAEALSPFRVLAAKR